MSGSVTYCLECGANNWADSEKCSQCGGKLAPTLREALLYYTNPKFREMVDGEKKENG